MFVFFFFLSNGGVSNEEILPRNLFISVIFVVRIHRYDRLFLGVLPVI